jgi:methylated-DNA-[protein]-cysteine S-methyltransferase
MEKSVYTVFETAWGFAGFSVDEGGVTRLCLPAASQRAAKAKFPGAAYDAGLMGDLQRALARYFEGKRVDFRTWPRVDPGRMSEFSNAILRACRQITYGDIDTYAGLARMVGRPGAARAVGTVLANNPVPLIVPCHRVVRSDGGLGGYSAEGGLKIKERLLRLESVA